MGSKGLSLILAIILSVTLQESQQASLPSDPYYTAGVVEFSPSSNVNSNLEDFLAIISSEEALPTDIIIFPESTLNNNNALTFVPDAESGVIPCDSVTEDYHEFFVAISCVAKTTRKYIVINLTEKEACPGSEADTRPCARNGLNTYNTNVVFDRDGRVISRYRKVHLYGEGKNVTFVPEFGFFDTDFGVRFGHFICYDILFYKPAEAMVKSMGIKDFIFSSMWFGQLPFLTGVQFQHSWAYANDVNLLAAGASRPMTGTTGSGIFNGRKGSIVSVMNRRLGERKIYVAQVPKFSDSSRRIKREVQVEIVPENRLSQTDIYLKRDDLDNYVSVLVNLTDGNSLTHELCYLDDDFCCKFDLSWHFRDDVRDGTKYYTYRLGVYNGIRYEPTAPSNQLLNCAIFSCIGDNITDCGKLFLSDTLVEPQVIFESIVIEGNYPKAKEYMLMPNSLLENMLPLSVEDFKWTETEEKSAIKTRFSLNKPIDNLLTMAIYSNYFDGELEKKDDGAAALKLSGILMTLVVAWIFY